MWKNYKEIQPDVEGYYIVWVKDNTYSYVWMLHWDDVLERFVSYNDYVTNDMVEYWMELPDKPIEDTIYNSKKPDMTEIKDSLRMVIIEDDSDEQSFPDLFSMLNYKV